MSCSGLIAFDNVSVQATVIPRTLITGLAMTYN